MLDTTVFWTSGLQVAKIYNFSRTFVSTIYFLKPFHSLLYLNNFTGSTRFSHLEDVYFYIYNSKALVI